MGVMLTPSGLKAHGMTAFEEGPQQFQKIGPGKLQVLSVGAKVSGQCRDLHRNGLLLGKAALQLRHDNASFPGNKMGRPCRHVPFDKMRGVHGRIQQGITIPRTFNSRENI